MNVGHLVERKRTEDAQNLATWAPLARRLRSDLEQYRRNIVTNAHDPYTVTKIRKYIEQAEAELARLEPRIKAINAFKYPTPQQTDRLSGLYTKAYQASIAAGFAESDVVTAEHNERPDSASDARKRKVEHEAEFVRANLELRNALEKFGLDPTPLCGRA